MNTALLRYRIRIGGLGWVASTAVGVVKDSFKRKQITWRRFELGPDNPSAPRVLYIHSGWAIETVGRLWFADQTLAQVTFVRAGDPVLTDEFMRQFEFVWYGYWALYHQHPSDPGRAIVAIHDPSELFTQKPAWKQDFGLSPKWRSHFLSMRKVVVISREMEEVMASLQVPTTRLPTTSTVPIRQATAIPPDAVPKVLAVGRIYPRKNFECFNDVARMAKAAGLTTRFRLKCDHHPVAEADYLAMLDDHPLYLCTSYQEGGPLPVMDAMRRGAVVISTPVGQVPEIIQHGINGFICHNAREMLESIRLLENNPAMLHSMRIRSLESIATLREPAVIHGAVNALLRDLLAESSLGTDQP